MKRSVGLSLAVSLIIGACVVAHAADVVSLNVVGYYTVDIANGFSLIGIPMEKIPAYRGTITANTTNVITDANATWFDGEFSQGVVGKEANGASTFFVEIATTNGSAFEGRYYTIITNSPNTLTVKNTDFLASDLLNKPYKIVAHNRIRDIFGEPTNPILQGGVSATVADNIYRWSGAGWASSIYCKTNTSHWMQGLSIADNMIVGRDEGLFINRRGAATNITVAGEVLQNAQGIVIGNGFSIIGGASVVDKAIVDAGLTGALTGGSSANTADNIYEWSGGGWAAAVYFRTNDMHWRQGLSNVDNTFLIRARKSYFINRKGSSTEWMRTSPLLVP